DGRASVNLLGRQPDRDGRGWVGDTVDLAQFVEEIGRCVANENGQTMDRLVPRRLQRGGLRLRCGQEWAGLGDLNLRCESGLESHASEVGDFLLGLYVVPGDQEALLG